MKCSCLHSKSARCIDTDAPKVTCEQSKKKQKHHSTSAPRRQRCTENDMRTVKKKTPQHERRIDRDAPRVTCEQSKKNYHSKSAHRQRCTENDVRAIQNENITARALHRQGCTENDVRTIKKKLPQQERASTRMHRERIASNPKN